MSKEKIRKQLRTISKSRIDTDVLDIKHVENLTADVIWRKLDQVVEVKLERNPEIMNDPDPSFSLSVLYPGIKRERGLLMEVYLDKNGSIIELVFDTADDDDYIFMNILNESERGKLIEIGLS